MPRAKTTTLKAILAGMELLDRLPAAAKLLLRPVANAPLLAGRMPVLLRAFMGATAFDLHDVDLRKGRIGIGGVEEIMAGSRLVELLHNVLLPRLGENGKNEALYELGSRLCRWEVSQALEQGRWAPRILVPLIANGEILREVIADPLMGRFFRKVMDKMSRLITDEGGWGHLEFDLSALPIRVVLSNSQEAAWLGPSDRPVCHLYAGIVAGYACTLSGRRMRATEIECKAMGAPACVFELREE